MATLPTLRPNADSVNGPLNWGTDAVYTAIDEAVADGVWIDGWHQTNNIDHSFLIDDTPSDFASMLTLSLTVRYSRVSSADDQCGLLARVVREENGAVLAAADSGGTFQTYIANGRDGGLSGSVPAVPVNGSTVAFSFVDTSASKPVWDGMRLELRQTYSAVMSADSTVKIYIDKLEFTGTYTASAAAEGRPYASRRRSLQAVHRAGSW